MNTAGKVLETILNCSCLTYCRMSGRDIHDVCQQAERRWASKVTCLTFFSAYVLSSKVSRSLPKSFKSILGLQVGSYFFLLYDVFVFCCSKYFFFSGLKFICIYRIYLSSKIHLDWIGLQSSAKGREALEITIQIFNHLSTGNKHSKNLPSLTPSSGWRS